MVRPYVPWLILAAGLRLSAAFFTPGFYHPDEHFQTLEFAHYRLGLLAATELPWEFEAQIRPFFQPAIYFGLFRLAQGLGQTDPLVWVLAARLLSAALATVGVGALMAAVPAWFEKRSEQVWAWALLAGLCVLPVLSARTSSENLGAAFFEVALGAWVARHFWWAGLAAGAAFLARYQLGFAVAGLGALLLYQRQLRPLVQLALGVVVMIGFGALLDRWGYGQWVFTPWRYVDVNLLQGKAAQFGERPAWELFGIVWHDLPKPLGALIFVALGITSLRFPKHPLVWSMVPFVLGHLVVSHKETRFLFPLVFVAPVLLVLAWGELGLHRWARAAAGVLLVLNGWWLGVGHHGQLLGGRWLKVLRDADPQGQTALYYHQEHPYGGPVIYFHLLGPRPQRAQPAPPDAIGTLPRPFFYFRYLRHQYPSVDLGSGCTLLYRDPPVLSYLDFLPWQHKAVRRSFDVREVRDLFICR